MIYRDNTGQRIKVGDHLTRDDKLYHHDAIYTGKGNVIHYNIDPDTLRWGDVVTRPPLSVREVPIETLMVGRPQDVSIVRSAENPGCVVDTARARLGEREYNLASNNCQTFVDDAFNGGQGGNSREIPDWIENSTVGAKISGALSHLAMAALAAKIRLTPGSLL